MDLADDLFRGSPADLTQENVGCVPGKFGDPGRIGRILNVQLDAKGGDAVFSVALDDDEDRGLFRFIGVWREG